MKLYRSFGVMGQELAPVYSAGIPAGEIYDEIEVTLPDGWSMAENEAMETLLTAPDGTVYLSYEVLSREGDAPALRWYDGDGERVQVLTVKEVR